MTETNDEIMVHLHIRSAISDVRRDMRELKLPLGALENRYVSMSNQLDRIDSRIERIKRRLDPTDA
jgi:hypothetical protein